MKKLKLSQESSSKITLGAYKLTLSVILSMTCWAGFGSASAISTVSCSTPGAPFASNSSACSALGTNGFAKAGAASNLTLPTTARDAAVIDASITASALETTFHGMTATATATSSADIALNFNTDGPVRNGLLELNFNQLDWTSPVNGHIRESLAIASYTADPNGADLVSVWIPIKLGTQFGFEYKQSVMAISSAFSGLTTAAIHSQISLMAFESDGATTVQLFDPPGAFTPEPATFGMIMTAGVLAVAFLRKQRR